MTIGDRTCAVSVDLDEVRLYHRIHGLGAPQGAAMRAVWERALPRHLRLFESLGIPATFFVVSEDLADADNAARARDLVRAGHEVANHSRTHPYDLIRLSSEEIRREVREAADEIERATGVRPVGFRAPGYNLSPAVWEALAEAGLRYDSSLLPSVPYFLAKAAVLGSMRLLGRTSASVLGDPRALFSPDRPHRHASGLVEIPIGVLPGGIPFIGTTLALAGAYGARALARLASVRDFVSLELHGIDLCDAELDGLSALRTRQPDLRRSADSKQAALRAAIESLRGRGYRFVRLADVSV